MKLNRVHHSAIIAADQQASKWFYCGVLGYELLTEVYRTERDASMGDPALNGEYLTNPSAFPAERLGPGARRPPGLRHLAFEVEVVEPVRAERIAKGVQCEPIRADPQTGRAMMFFVDPDG